MRECVYTPVVVPPCARQFVDGAGDVPQHVPRAEMEAGCPRDVTLAPRVALVEVIEVCVGVVTEGTTAQEVTGTPPVALLLAAILLGLTFPPLTVSTQ